MLKKTRRCPVRPWCQPGAFCAARLCVQDVAAGVAGVGRSVLAPFQVFGDGAGLVNWLFVGVVALLVVTLVRTPKP